MGEYKVAIISPFRIVGEGLESRLEREKDFIISGVGNDYTEAMRLVRNLDSDIIVAGISPGFWGGSKVIEEIRAQDGSLPILVCSGCKDNYYANSCLRKGANGYILMSESDEKIVEAVRSVLGDGEYISEGIVKIETPVGGYVLPRDCLTTRELYIFTSMSYGLDNAHIANDLHIKSGTVRTHIRSIAFKLGFHEISDLRHWAVGYAIQQARLNK